MHVPLRLLVLLAAAPALALDIHVSPQGNDAGDGSVAEPVASLARARDLVRAFGKAGKEAVTVHVQPGQYFLPETLVFSAADSGTREAPVVYRAAPGGDVALSGGARLALVWEKGAAGLFTAHVPADKGSLPFDQLFVNGVRQPMARYPNFDATVQIYNGYAADAFAKVRAARWSDPAGGYIHAMHAAHWGGYHYRITGKAADGEVTYEGGWQNNRQMGMHKAHRFVENIREELDAPGEWFHDAKAGVLHFMPPASVASAESLATSVVEVVRLPNLVEFSGTREQPVRFVSLQGFTFRHAARTFMATKEPLLRSDWTIHRGGAVFFNGAEDCQIENATFDQVGGNTVFVNDYNRRIAIRGCLIRDSGGNGVAFVGDPKAVRNPLFEYKQRQRFADIDLTPGPIGENFPADCTVEDCLITRIGRVEKQAAAIQISMAQGITIRHCSIYEVPRAGINISEGTWGGHLIDGCDIFDTVLETGDHGSFNSWGRDRFWGLQDVPPGKLPELALLDVVKTNVIRNSRWRCDHGWDIDLDDGSSNYEIYNNLLLHGGLKLREGFHRRAWNNITVNNSLHPHVWYDDSRDEITANIFMAAYKPAGGMPKGKWGRRIDGNFFASGEADRLKFAANGCDAASVSGGPQFVDPATGDYRVKETSPALQTGFRNFPMDQFGVQSPWLKRIAKTPELPSLQTAATGRQTVKPATARVMAWQGAPVRELEGEEFSAYGVAKDAGGVRLVDVPAGSLLAGAGLRTEDLIQTLGGQPVRTIRELLERTDAAGAGVLRVGYVRGQAVAETSVSNLVLVAREASTSGSFQALSPRLGSRVRIPIFALAAKPTVNNEPLSSLRDGEIARHYGPVFANGVRDGMYRIDLGAVTGVAEVVTWSFAQGGQRGAQRFTLFGSASPADPGWDVTGRNFRAIASVDSPSEKDFLATSIRRSDGAILGEFRWLVWAVEPVTRQDENTAFQEFQIRAATP